MKKDKHIKFKDVLKKAGIREGTIEEDIYFSELEFLKEQLVVERGKIIKYQQQLEEKAKKEGYSCFAEMEKDWKEQAKKMGIPYEEWLEREDEDDDEFWTNKFKGI